LLTKALVRDLDRAGICRPDDERDHGPEFWAALEQAMPDWRQRKEDLAYRAKNFLVFDCGGTLRTS
jgi:hypothetical protein